MSKCTKCGTNFVGTPEEPPKPGLCKYCEIEKLKSDNLKLRTALVGLVGVDTLDGLNGMQSALDFVPDPEDSRMPALVAIRALRDTLST